MKIKKPPGSKSDSALPAGLLPPSAPSGSPPVTPSGGKSKALTAANPVKKSKAKNTMSKAFNRRAEQALTPLSTDRGNFTLKG